MSFQQVLTAGSILRQLTSESVPKYTPSAVKIENQLRQKWLTINRWVVLINGLGVITLPDNSTSTITTAGGELGLLFATDTVKVSKQGHGGFFPGVTETIVLQIPTKDNKIPKHRVLYDDKPCTANEYTGLRAWATGG